MVKKCNTKYPVLLVHGAGFRDRKYLNYWGRIPKSLEQEGARIYYGNQDSWGSVEHNAMTLKSNIEKLLADTGQEKVNIIAHSKGGLEARYVISSLGMASKVSSLTTLATPHHGSKTIDMFLRLPKFLYKAAAFFTDLCFRCLGDKNPDFYTASRHFSTAHMREFNRRNPDADSVYYQSYGAVMRNGFSDLIFFWSHLFVSVLEGENDGIVSLDSSKWTNFRGVLRGVTNRGISHADVVDARRWNFSGKNSGNGVADIRDIYISIVSELKSMGF